MDIGLLSSACDGQDIEQLCDTLISCVDNGASVGFFAPLSREDARTYWKEVIADITQDRRLCWVIRFDGRIVATVQLHYSRKPNSRHRAEIQRLLVHSHFRRRGLAELLMHHAERYAYKCGIKLLMLMTRADGVGPLLYTKMGFVLCGEIPDFTYTPFGEPHASLQFYKALTPVEFGKEC